MYEVYVCLFIAKNRYKIWSSEKIVYWYQNKENIEANYQMKMLNDNQRKNNKQYLKYIKYSTN